MSRTDTHVPIRATHPDAATRPTDPLAHTWEPYDPKWERDWYGPDGMIYKQNCGKCGCCRWERIERRMKRRRDRYEGRRQLRTQDFDNI